MKYIKAYYSASIRGAAGEDATEEQIQENLLMGIQRGNEIQQFFGSVLKLYIPHQHDSLVQILWKNEFITSKQILLGDKIIIQECDFMMVDGFHSLGVEEEIECCKEHNISVYYLHTNLKKDILHLHDGINSLLHRKYDGEETSQTQSK